MEKTFLLPKRMKELGFDCTKNEHPYLVYKNDGTKHYNKDYNATCPEPKGKVIIYVNFEYSDDNAYVGIRQDGDTRSVYGGVCPNEEFFVQLLHNVR